MSQELREKIERLQVAWIAWMTAGTDRTLKVLSCCVGELTDEITEEPDQDAKAS